jgi:hypothetical protein
MSVKEEMGQSANAPRVSEAALFQDRYSIETRLLASIIFHIDYLR